MAHPTRWLANCSMLFTERPLLERPAAARAAGFDAIELWWPWPEQPVPAAAEVDALVAAVQDAGVQLVGLNFFAGDLAGADCGVASVPGRSGQLEDNLEVALDLGGRLGVSAYNALWGNRVEGADPAEQDALGLHTLGLAAAAARRAGATVLVEPISGPKPYPLRTADDAARVVTALRAAGHDNTAVLWDAYHLSVNGEDLAAALARHAHLVGHVQVADAPGRGEPGSGALDLTGHLADLAATGYDRLGRPRVPPHHHDRAEPRLAPAPRARRRHDHHHLHEEHRMSTIAFIGLGIMGSPMALHLQRAGHDVVGHNLDPERTRPLVEAGGRAATSIAEAVKAADVVAVMVPDSPDVTAVLTGEDGVLAHAQPGTLVIDFSSIRPDVAADLAAQARAAGLRMIDAPVSGGEAGARQATLSIMVGGSPEDVAEARPVLEAVGRTIAHVGPSGAGQTVKAANQLVVAAHLQALSEALVFLEAHGVDTAAALDVLGGGLAGSAVLQQKREGMLARTFEPGFRIDLHHKDMGIVVDAARTAGVVLPLGALVSQLVAAARAQGDGGLDHSALLRGVERLSGRPATTPETTTRTTTGS